MSKIFKQFDELPFNVQEKYKKMFQEFLTNPELSYQNISDHFTETTSIKTDRKSIALLMNELGVPKRSPEMIRLSKKTLGINKKSESSKKYEEIIQNVGVENLKQDYKKESLSSMAEKHKTTTFTIVRALESLGVQIKENPISYIEYIQILEDKGFYAKDIEKIYLDGRTFASFKEEIEKITNLPISNTSIYRLLKQLNIKKDSKAIRKQQSNGSKAKTNTRNELLKTIGFSSPEEVAKFYNENTSYSYEKIIEMLNESLGYEEFTIKWFMVNVYPFIDKRKKRMPGISYEEKTFIDWLDEVTPQYEVIRNSRNIIPPREIDAYIPALNLAIEFNGLPWHERDYILKTRNMDAYDFHKSKFEKCKQKGITLIFVWSDDWGLNKDLMKQLVIEKINNPSKEIPMLNKFLSNKDMKNSFQEIPNNAELEKKVKKMYKKLGTVEKVAKELGTSRVFVRQCLNKQGIETKQFTYIDVIQLLKKEGIKDVDLKVFYIDENHTKKELIDHIVSLINLDKKIGIDMIDRIINYYNIKK